MAAWTKITSFNSFDMDLLSYRQVFCFVIGALVLVSVVSSFSVQPESDDIDFQVSLTFFLLFLCTTIHVCHALWIL